MRKRTYVSQQIIQHRAKLAHFPAGCTAIFMHDDDGWHPRTFYVCFLRVGSPAFNERVHSQTPQYMNIKSGGWHIWENGLSIRGLHCSVKRDAFWKRWTGKTAASQGNSSRITPAKRTAAASFGEIMLVVTRHGRGSATRFFDNAFCLAWH